MIRFLLPLLITMLMPAAAEAATPLVADVSNYRIDIDSGFNGTRIFLFGARNDIGDVVVVVRGPSKDYIVRKKEKIAGIWVNRERMKFFNVPDFYAIAASKTLADIESNGLFRQLGIGQDKLLVPAGASSSKNNSAEFEDAFLRYQWGRKLYMSKPEKVSFMGETLFKTVVDFPDNIPPGNYTAEIYLLSNNEVVGMQSTPIQVVKSGFDAFLSTYAHEHPTLYGITAIVVALFVGWFTGRLFEKI
jgi:uncharacterized protein (TIGR02186 family)